MRTLTFTVPLRGQPQGSSSAYKRGSHIVVTSANKKLKPFRAEVFGCAKSAVIARFWDDIPFKRHYPVTCDLTFTFARPESVSETTRPFHVVKPDLDKLARGVFDALTGSLWADDAQCVQLTCRKLYGASESVQITVSDWEG